MTALATHAFFDIHRGFHDRSMAHHAPALAGHEIRDAELRSILRAQRFLLVKQIDRVVVLVVRPPRVLLRVAASRGAAHRAEDAVLPVTRHRCEAHDAHESDEHRPMLMSVAFGLSHRSTSLSLTNQSLPSRRYSFSCSASVNGREPSRPNTLTWLPLSSTALSRSIPFDRAIAGPWVCRVAIRRGCGRGLNPRASGPASGEVSWITLRPP